MPLLDVKDLNVDFHTEDGLVSAVDGISFRIGRDETLGIVGESGCGKSVTALSILRLVPEPPGDISADGILFEGTDLLKKTEKQMRSVRGNDISMIFQEPMTSLDPVFTIGDQIGEAIEYHQRVSKKEGRRRAVDMLKKVGIPSPEMRIDDYPFQLSGGMRQRVMIAIALSCNPKLLIADEPTTALDVTIQAQIMELMVDLKKEYHTAILLITHDLGLVAEVVDRMVVMYCGRIVESGRRDDIFRNPRHPYTLGLMGSVPQLDRIVERLSAIKGAVPGPFEIPPGCRFHPRCTYARSICREGNPDLLEIEPEHQVRCWFWEEVG